MSKINILPSKVYNRISAGEVVDRPYSVVKELIENSIDAKAKNIEAYIERGGKTLIKIIDDGDGIAFDDLKSAFLPHATSKLKTADDLNNILTLGFRGEALASIGSVAMCSIVSKTKDGEGHKITCEGGKLSEVIEYPSAFGTEITIESLFYNTPVREKFLKTDKGEEADIINYVSRLVMANPSVSFKFYSDNKLVLQSFGDGIESAICSVYGSKVISSCYKIDTEKHGVKISGYIGKPDFTKANKTYQSVFLNGRYISNSTISSAILNAYSNYLMKRQYPFYVLYITVPSEIVDVNVHPNKADVRFSNNQIIYGCIYSVVSGVLDGLASAVDVVVKDNFSKQLDFSNFKNNTISQKQVNNVEQNQVLPNKSIVENFWESYKLSEPRKSVLEVNDSGKQDDIDVFAENKKYLEELEKKSKNNFEFNDNLNDASPKTEDNLKINDENLFKSYDNINDENLLKSSEKYNSEKSVDLDSFNYVGKIFNTYLIYEKGEDVYLIDQHACHERLIFNRLMKSFDERKICSQPLILPYILNVNASESVFLNGILPTISELGFDIEEFGLNCFKISAVPCDLLNINIDDFFAEILREVNSLKQIKLNNLLRDKIATMACKKAVKGGMDLTNSEIKELFSKMNGNFGLKCPHGRPVVTKISKYEIEKMFKRIV